MQERSGTKAAASNGIGATIGVRLAEAVAMAFLAVALLLSPLMAEGGRDRASALGADAAAPGTLAALAAAEVDAEQARR